MRCIFCKSDSSKSITIEHIIPESLGNIEHTLPHGVICDNCNNYFSHEVEKPLLETEYFIYLRFQKRIFSKKGIIPRIKGFYLNAGSEVEFSRNNDEIFVYPQNDHEIDKFIEHLDKDKKGTILIPVPPEPNQYLMARFLAKIGLEVMAQRVLDVPGGLNEIIDKPELDEIRNYARRGDPKKKDWIFNKRKIYPEDAIFYEDSYSQFDILHEYMLLYTPAQELYFVIAFFGIEYAINMGELCTMLSVNCNER
ncbi:MAG: HNH endonuclease [Anaerolineales bacterium]